MTDHNVRDLASLLSLYGQAQDTTRNKEVSKINAAYRTLIEAASFFVLATSGPDGLDCSPRGDANCAVKIHDAKTLLIPDRRGNNRLDSLRNIIHDPQLACLFLIPGWNEALRVNGNAQISTSPDLLEQFEANGSLPATVIVLEIETMYFQCARAIKRAGLWDKTSNEVAKTLPTAGALIRSAITEFDGDAYDETLDERQSKTLY